MKRYSLMYHPPTMANDDCGDYVLYREARAEIDEAWSAGHLSATTEDVELMDAMKEKHKAEIDEQTEQINRLTTLLDEQYGTPCEQIRHQAEIDLLNKRIDELEKDCSTLISVKNKQQAEIDWLQETIETGDCWVSSFISSVCDKGTKGCIANHKHKGE